MVKKKSPTSALSVSRNGSLNSLPLILNSICDSMEKNGKRKRGNLYILKNLNQINIGKFFVTDTESEQKFKHRKQGIISLETQAVIL